MKCALCKGTGKQTLTVSSIGSNPIFSKTPTKTEIDCIICNGSGEMTAKDAALIEFENNMWCECKIQNPQDVRYYKDGQHPEISKHHWRCTVCKKVRQIG